MVRFVVAVVVASDWDFRLQLYNMGFQVREGSECFPGEDPDKAVLGKDTQLEGGYYHYKEDGNDSQE